MPPDPATPQKSARTKVTLYSLQGSYGKYLLTSKKLSPQTLYALNEATRALIEYKKRYPTPKPPPPQKTESEWLAEHNQLTPEDISDLDSSAGAVIESREPPPTPPTIPRIPPGVTMELTRYPKWWKDSNVWGININKAGTWPVIPATPGYNTYVATIIFTVSDEVNITFDFGTTTPSGPMDFGGENEPRAAVMSMADSPVPCGENGFKITSDTDDVQISGFVVYYYEKK